MEEQKATQAYLAGRSLAAERWRILKKVVLSAVRGSPNLGNNEGSPTARDAIDREPSSTNDGRVNSTASVMSFSSFNLLVVRQLPAGDPGTTTASQTQSSEAPQQSKLIPSHSPPPPRELWRTYSYTKTQLDSNSVLTVEADVRHVVRALSVDALLGFNNTGNVCLWPSEEVMAYHCLEHVEEFRDCSVCELGGGMTCLAGLMLACSRAPRDVWLTDGNETSVENVIEIVSLPENRARFGDTAVSASVLRWDRAFLSEPSPSDAKYDFVVCSDCLFFDKVHAELARVILKLVKPGGRAWLFAPGRSGSLERFCSVAGIWFDVSVRRQYSEPVWQRHQEAMRTLGGERGQYLPDLHYPLMVILRPL